MTKISALSDIGTSVDSNDTFVLVDVSDPTTPNKKIQQQNLFLIPDGSAGTPGLRFLSDTNVGLFRPTTDTLAIATGGSECLRIDSSGRLGLGTTSPIGKLTVGNSSNSFLVSIDSSSSYAEIQAYNAPLYINRQGNDTIFNSGGGNVGIGTTSPSVKLDIQGLGTASAYTSAGNAGIKVDFGTNNNGVINLVGGGDLGIYRSNNSGVYDVGIGFGDNSNRILRFDTTGTERARIDSSGRLGLGTSSPSSLLDVEGIITAKSGTFDAGGFLNKYGGDTNSRSWWIKSDTHSYGDFAIRQSTTRTGSTYDTKLLIDASGRVGIGTTSPSRLLHCSGTGGQEILLTALTSGDVRFGMDVVGSTYNWIDSERSSKALKFGVDNTERARIDSSGRLLVGTSSARVNYYNSAGIGSNFQVVGSTHAESSIILHNQAANAQGAYFHIGKSRGTAYEVVNNNDPLGVISFQGADGSTMREGANITAFVDGVPGASDLPTRLVFSTTADGASSPTERMRIKSNGTINFSNVATYADNAAATTGGLAVGDVYRTSTGQLMIRY